MTDTEFERFCDRQRREYVESLARSRSPEEARRKADDDRGRLLPEGAATALYASAGDRVTAQQMAKPLDGG